MTKESLKFISDALTNAGINYEFGAFLSSSVPETYFVGEYNENSPVNEDGMQETTFMLTGTSRKSIMELETDKQIIRSLFPEMGGKTAILSNGNGIAVFYSNSLNVPVDDIELRRIQINLTIKEWSVN